MRRDNARDLHAETKGRRGKPGATRGPQESNRTRLLDVIPSIRPLLSFFLRPEGRRSGLSGQGSYRVRLHHHKPRNRRVTHAVGGCKSGKARRAFDRAIVHLVPNDPLFVLLPDFVAQLASRFGANLLRRDAWQRSARRPTSAKVSCAFWRSRRDRDQLVSGKEARSSRQEL